jgi:WD40 repeat protein
MLEPVETIYLSRPHSQPILSLDASPSATVYFTSSADATIAAHRIPDKPLNIYDNENAPGDAGTGRSTEPLPVRQNATTGTDSAPSKPSGLSALFSKAASQPTVGAGIPKVNELTIQAPYKVVQTKHAGQQSLRVRSDGRLLVTAGWDSRVRIYSTKTLKEVAVLKWHKEGVYATDFAQILQSDDSTAENPHNQGGIAGTSDDLGASVQVEDTSLVQKRLGGLRRLQEQREAQMQAAHWVVAGAKDGKVSLWEVF